MTRNNKLTSFEKVYKTAIEAFNYDKDKALAWYMSKLPILGLSPYEMCKAGQARKVLKILEKTLIN